MRKRALNLKVEKPAYIIGHNYQYHGHNCSRTKLFTGINLTDLIFSNMIIHAKDFCVQVMSDSVIIMSDSVILLLCDVTLANSVLTM